MATVSSISDFWIKPNAIDITLNALGDPNFIQVSLTGGAVIMVFIDGVISYDAAHNYQKWPLLCYPTVFSDDQEKYVYARIPNPKVPELGNDALIIFSSEKLDLYGEPLAQNAVVDPNSTPAYFFIYLAAISASETNEKGEKQPRDWIESFINSGTLSTDYSIREEAQADWKKMFSFEAVSNMILPKLPFVSAFIHRLGIGPEHKEITNVKRSLPEDAKVPVSDNTLPTTKYVDETAVSSVHDDTAKGNITFEQKVMVGKFIDSLLAGSGIGLLPDGRIQTDRLEVRGSMTVMDLIINEIHAMAGEFSFSDCGKIEKVEEVNAAESTYKLWMEKQTETDLTTLAEEDIVLSIVNNLRVGGKDYYSSWMRVVDKNAMENSLTVVLYPDDQVPGGKNYVPQAGYNVTRKGNAVVPEKGQKNERAQNWFLSSREGRIAFLANVYQPILKEYNYAISVGQLPDLKPLRDIEVVGEMGIYAKIIACERICLIDYNGDITSTKVERGEWSKAVAEGDKPYRFVEHVRVYPNGKNKYTELEQHTVYHHGCKWGCIKDKTLEEPKWNAKDWTMLEGDTNYYLDFLSSQGWQFRPSNMRTEITAQIAFGNQDITEALLATKGSAIEWLRDTGNVPNDNSWQPTFIDGKPNRILLTTEDMGLGWGNDYFQVQFICRVHIPVGDDFNTIENSINIK